VAVVAREGTVDGQITLQHSSSGVLVLIVVVCNANGGEEVVGCTRSKIGDRIKLRALIYQSS
jgi:hypothetical protein